MIRSQSASASSRAINRVREVVKSAEFAGP